jgi:pimeloyl-ACP methyl ester carboxylesterase
VLWFRRTRQSNLMESFADKNPEVTLSYLGALATLEGPQRYASLPMPVEFVYGARTFRAVRRSVEQWKATLPRLRVHRIEGAGHLLLDEAPQAVAAIIRDGR